MSSFGELVKQQRERSGMNKQKFAESLGISSEHLRVLENGESRSPSAIILARMVAVLHLSPKQAFLLLKAVREDAKESGDAHS